MTELPDLRTGRLRTEQGHCRPTDGLEIPFGLLEGADPGPCLLVTAGVHGSEYCSIEAALRLMKMDPATIRGTLLVLPILNVQGFRARSIYVMPEDGKNLNRMFPGRPDGTASERLAHWLVTRVFTEVDAYLDLHGGDLDEALVPFSIFPGESEPSKGLARAFGIPIAVAAGPGGNSINGALAVGVPSLLAEVGGNGIWDEAGVTQLVDGVVRVMGHLGMLREPVPQPAADPEVVGFWVPKAAVDGLWYPAKPLSAPVAVGERLGELRDVFGTVLATVESDVAGTVLYLLSSLTVSAGEALLGVGTSP